MILPYYELVRICANILVEIHLGLFLYNPKLPAIPLSVNLIHFVKFGNKIKWDKLWELLLDMGVPALLDNITEQLLINSSATVKID